ncbi:MAG: hypothetical protein ACE5IO_10495, partial [Thermoplasmata archaeon]
MEKAHDDNVGRNNRIMPKKMKAIILTGILVLSVLVTSLAMIGLDSANQRKSGPDNPYFPDYPDYDGFLYTIPSVNLQT